jgi:hypothetical protein
MGNACVLSVVVQAADVPAPLALEPTQVIGALPLPSFGIPPDAIAAPVQTWTYRKRELRCVAQRWPGAGQPCG